MSQLTYLPFADKKWHLSMGLRVLNLQEWIEIDDNFVAQLKLKDKLLKNRYADVLAALPGSQASQQEVLDLLLEHLLEQFPQHYRRQGSTISNLSTGQVWQIADFQAAPLDLAGRLVQEDLLIMQPAADGYILAAASLCFPFRWRLREKLGLGMTQIHQQIPGYQAKLERPVDSFFERLQANYSVWRSNWGIVDSPELFLTPEAGTQDSNTLITTENAGERLWIRVERQTLRRLVVGGDILFTIHTYLYPLQVLENDSVRAHNCAEVLKQMPDKMQGYKNLLPFREAILSYLEQVEARGTQH